MRTENLRDLKGGSMEGRNIKRAEVPYRRSHKHWSVASTLPVSEMLAERAHHSSRPHLNATFAFLSILLCLSLEALVHPCCVRSLGQPPDVRVQ